MARIPTTPNRRPRPTPAQVALASRNASMATTQGRYVRAIFDPRGPRFSGTTGEHVDGGLRHGGSGLHWTGTTWRLAPMDSLAPGDYRVDSAGRLHLI